MCIHNDCQAINFDTSEYGAPNTFIRRQFKETMLNGVDAYWQMLQAAMCFNILKKTV
jgi:hypothetical protein